MIGVQSLEVDKFTSFGVYQCRNYFSALLRTICLPTPDFLCRYTTIPLPVKMPGEVWLIFEMNMREIPKETRVG